MKIMGHLTTSMDIRYWIVDCDDTTEVGRKIAQPNKKKLRNVN